MPLGVERKTSCQHVLSRSRAAIWRVLAMIKNFRIWMIQLKGLGKEWKLSGNQNPSAKIRQKGSEQVFPRLIR